MCLGKAQVVTLAEAGPALEMGRPQMRIERRTTVVQKHGSCEACQNAITVVQKPNKTAATSEQANKHARTTMALAEARYGAWNERRGMAARGTCNQTCHRGSPARLHIMRHIWLMAEANPRVPCHSSRRVLAVLHTARLLYARRVFELPLPRPLPHARACAVAHWWHLARALLHRPLFDHPPLRAALPYTLATRVPEHCCWLAWPLCTALAPFVVQNDVWQLTPLLRALAVLWSVLFGHFELAHMLWPRTCSPLRTALIARQCCLSLRKMVHSRRGSIPHHRITMAVYLDPCTALSAQLYAQLALIAPTHVVPTLQEPSSRWTELTDAADKFEQWALGTLNHIIHSEDAADLITNAPTMREDGLRPDAVKGRVTHFWQGSVLKARTDPNGTSTTRPMCI
jgi:hypothetical protein